MGWNKYVTWLSILRQANNKQQNKRLPTTVVFEKSIKILGIPITET